MKHAALLLAAGGSRRLGRAKQLLDWEGQPLVRFIAALLLETSPSALVVATGARRLEVAAALDGLPWTEAYNPAWESGMASSLQRAQETLARMNDTAESRAVLIAATDQPFLTRAHLKALLRASKGTTDALTHYGTSSDSPAQSNGEKRWGIPACLTPATLARASELRGDKGFRALWRENLPPLVDAPDLERDVDTPEEWEEIQQLRKRRLRTEKTSS